MPAARMHQTTVRFGPDLWDALELEAARIGVSVAHYVRDAALARLIQTNRKAPGRLGDEIRALGETTRALGETVENQLDSAEAVRAQGRLARARAQRVREESGELRSRVRSQSR